MNLDLGNILSRAWKITWNNKILWLFGVLAALGSGGGGNGGSSNFNFRGNPSDLSPRGPNLPPELERWFSDLRNVGPTILAIIIGVICVLFLIGLVVYVLSLLGQGGLIGGARLADANGHVTFGEAWELARRYAWRLFLINLPAILLGLLVVVIAIVTAVAVVGIFAGNANPGPNSAIGVLIGVFACVVPLACVVGLVGLALRILIFFARFAVVLEDLAPMAALRRGWEILKSNFISILILGIILVIGGAVFGFIIALPLIVAVLPVVIGIIGTAATNQAMPLAAGGIFALVCCAVYVPVLIFLRGVFETWATSAWTLAYQQFIGAHPAAPVAPYPLAPGSASA
jgi:hypothetical protein